MLLGILVVKVFLVGEPYTVNIFDEDILNLDFKELRLKENKDYKGDEVKGDEYLDSNQSEFLCPVTTLPMNGINSFVVNWKCEVRRVPWMLWTMGSERLRRLISHCEGSEKKDAVNGEIKKEEHNHKDHSHKKKEEKEKSKKAEKRKAESDIQSDPTKSEAYKKLFTTCEEAKKKPTQHWITYNPLYY
ncbi:hypothetical protein ANCDUO_11916 [Ancylostoma duodenale]|uniref:Uncharacterized protein n=1 Tax=Ancylostoma duodenale TaxID=51022 RepID=A0A0C2CMQ1_9BILA|nr:hypothetical protein ANCDUO_11916 [Ancylostoma duodenale]